MLKIPSVSTLAVLLSAVACTPGPRVQSMSPSADAIARIDTSVAVTFSRPVVTDTVKNAFSLLEQEGKSVSGTVSYSPETNTATFIPAAPLSHGRRYTASIGRNITDLDGNPLASIHSWSFETEKAEVHVAWDPNPEPAVNTPGGGYRVYYATSPDFPKKGTSVINIPYRSGGRTRTSVVVPLSKGTYYFAVIAYTAAFPQGSEPSEKVSFTVP